MWDAEPPQDDDLRLVRREVPDAENGPDLFDRQPIRYSREKEIVYSVGTDLEDFGGSEGIDEGDHQLAPDDKEDRRSGSDSRRRRATRSDLVTPRSFEDVLSSRDWKPIRGCPGRYVLPGEHDLEPTAIVGAEADVSEHRVARARDLVVVSRVDDWGLISYRRDNGTYRHTLNTPEGLARKLSDLGIARGGPGG